MENVVYLTKKGFKDLKKSITRLEQQKSHIQQSLRDSDHTSKRDDRLDINERIAQIEVIEADITEKQLLLRSAKLIPKRPNSLTVMIGSAVELLDPRGKRLSYMLVDSVEADPSKGKISISSPLGRNLIGKRIRDAVQWTTGKGSRQMTLIGIH